MPEIYRLERSLQGMGAAACSNCSSLHPLTHSAAATLTGEPGLARRRGTG